MDKRLGLGLSVPLATAVLIFLATALMGVWAAPVRSAALIRFCLFLVGFWLAIGMTVFARYKADVTFGVLGLLGALLAAYGAIHFLLTVNWAEEEPHRLVLLHQVGLWIHANSLELSKVQNLHKNITGGALIMLLPLGLGGAIWAWTRSHWLLFVITVVALLVSVLSLIMTTSRGAWLGFGLAITYTIYFSWRLRPGPRSRLHWLLDLLMVVLTIALIGAFIVPLNAPNAETVPYLIIGNSLGTRTGLWQDSLPLIQDYPFTGSGLGSTTMIYSSYIFLLHVPYLSHAHNLYLQIAIEQGIPGLIAFVAMVIFSILGLIAVYRQGNFLTRVFSAATFAVLIAMLGHGMIEAGLYAHGAVPLIFLPFGLSLGLLLGETGQQPLARSTTDIRRVTRYAIYGSLAPLVAILALFLMPGTVGAYRANMGAVAQSRAELAVYRWPDWPIQDELRRNDAVDLSAAMDHFAEALVLDPANVTAHRRLGQIAISHGNYEMAQNHLERAYSFAPDQRATRQMLGELYAIQGHLDQAIQLWQTVDTTTDQLDARYWWHSHIGAEEHAAWLKQAIIQLNTTN